MICSCLLSCCYFNLLLRNLSLENGMGMGVVKLCIISFVVTAKDSKVELNLHIKKYVDVEGRILFFPGWGEGG